MIETIEKEGDLINGKEDLLKILKMKVIGKEEEEEEEVKLNGNKKE